MSVLYITNKCPHYRIPLFNELSKNLDIKFVFTNEDKVSEDLNTNYLLSKGIGFGKYKIHFDLIKVLFIERPNKVVLLPPDPLHLIDNIFLVLICLILNIKFYFHVGRWDYNVKTFRYKFSDFFYSFLFKFSSGFFSYSFKSKEWLIKMGVNCNKIDITYNINPYIFNQKNSLAKIEYNKYVLFVGRIIERKGLKYLIEAFSKLNEKDLKLLIIGGEDFYKLGAKSEESYIKELIKKKKLGDKIIMLGNIYHHKIYSYYKNANMLIIPSITIDVGEAWGHVVEEALYFGVPVISTDAVGSAFDLIENGKNGFIVKEKSVDELIDAIKKISSNLIIMKNNAFKSIRNSKYRLNNIVKIFVDRLR